MDKQTLSNYGWVVVLILILTVLIALATPFGTYVKDAVKSTTEGMFSVSENALNKGLGEAGVTVNKAEFNDVPTVGGNNNQGEPEPAVCEHTNMKTYVDDKKCDDCGYVEYGSNIHNGLIPEGGKFVDAIQESICLCGHTEEENFTNHESWCAEDYDTQQIVIYTEYNAGDVFPAENNWAFESGDQRCDTYYYGNRKYIYTHRFNPSTEMPEIKWFFDSVVDSSLPTGATLTNINGCNL